MKIARDYAVENEKIKSDASDEDWKDLLKKYGLGNIIIIVLQHLNMYLLVKRVVEIS